MQVDLRLGDVHSLKEKRAVIRPIVDGAAQRFRVAAAEVDHQDNLHLSSVGMAAVSASAGHAQDMMDSVERFIWSFPEVEVVDVTRHWSSREDW